MVCTQYSRAGRRPSPRAHPSQRQWIKFCDGRLDKDSPDAHMLEAYRDGSQGLQSRSNFILVFMFQSSKCLGLPPYWMFFQPDWVTLKRGTLEGVKVKTSRLFKGYRCSTLYTRITVFVVVTQIEVERIGRKQIVK